MNLSAAVLGFPLGSALNGAVDAVVANRKKAAAKGAGEDKKAMWTPR